MRVKRCIYQSVLDVSECDLHNPTTLTGMKIRRPNKLKSQKTSTPLSVGSLSVRVGSHTVVY